MEEVIKMWDGVKDVLWSEHFWLPSTATWEDLKRNETVFYPDASDLYYPIPLAVVLFILRLMWERFVALPLGRWYRLNETAPLKAEHNDLLEKTYRRLRGKRNDSSIMGLSKQLDWTPRRIERWWRMRRLQSKPSEMQRFRETSWRFAFYFLSFWLGLYVLLDKPWLYETIHCWVNYPKQEVTSDIWWFYMFELSFYWSLVLSLFMDVKRKDFVEMIVHHIATILLMSMSYTANMIRVGTLVLVVHDSVDYILEFGKLAKYCKYNRFCDVLFVIFAILFFITRLVIFPFRIINSTMFEAVETVGMAPIYYVYNGLLCVLQVLHIFWFMTIVKMAYGFLVSGEIEKDARSDSEDDLDVVGGHSDDEQSKSKSTIGDVPDEPFKKGSVNISQTVRK